MLAIEDATVLWCPACGAPMERYRLWSRVDTRTVVATHLPGGCSYASGRLSLGVPERLPPERREAATWAAPRGVNMVAAVGFEPTVSGL